MFVRVSGALAAAVVFTLAAPVPGQASPTQSQPAFVLAQASGTDAPARRSRQRSEKTRVKREPTVSQMAARERQKKCAAEWKGAKTAGTVATGAKWPKFWSACNARLKGNSA